MFKRYGIKSVSMDDVAKENGISKKTLYKFVSDKNDLIRRVVEFESKRLIALRQAIYLKELNAIEEVFAMHPIILEIMKKYNPVIEYDLKKYHNDIYQEIMNLKAEQMYEHVVLNLKKGIEEGLYRKNIDVDIIAKIRVSTEISRMQSEKVELAHIDGEKALMQLIEYHLRAVCSPEGIKLMERKLKEIESA